MTLYRCSSCGVENTAINDLAGVAHTRTAGRPSGCDGVYQPAEEVEVRWTA